MIQLFDYRGAKMIRGISPLFVAIYLFLFGITYFQEGKSAGLSGSISGMADSYWENKCKELFHGRQVGEDDKIWHFSGWCLHLYC